MLSSENKVSNHDEEIELETQKNNFVQPVKKTRKVKVKQFSIRKCLQITGAISCLVLVTFFGFIIFIASNSKNAGLPDSSSAYTIYVKQGLIEKLTNKESGTIELIPRRYSHEITLIWLHDYGQNAKDQISNFITSRELTVRSASISGFLGGIGGTTGVTGGRGGGGGSRGRGLQFNSRAFDSFKPFVLNTTKIVIPQMYENNKKWFALLADQRMFGNEESATYQKNVAKIVDQETLKKSIDKLIDIIYSEIDQFDD